MNEPIEIFKQIEEHSYTSDKCFLCGCTLNGANRSVEHVIPKWLQKKFNLWDQKITLLNGTYLSYRQLTIPCCIECNNIHLRPFENKIFKAFNNGYEAFKNLDEESVFLWLGKIYFGLMYRELFLNVDRSNPEKGTITDKEYLESFKSHFLFLQGIRGKHKFKDFFPASLYLYKTQKPNKLEQQWDLFDNHYTLFISIRMGEIGLIAALQDGEATKELKIPLVDFRGISLHPLQFREISAQILYKTMLMNRTPKYISIQNTGVLETIMMSLQGASNKPIFDDWDNDYYAQLLSLITKVPLEICQPEKGKAWTWLMNKKGKPLFIDVNKHDIFGQ